MKRPLLFLVPIALWIGLYFIGMWQAENINWQKLWPGLWWVATDVLFLIATVVSFAIALFVNEEE